MPISFNNVDASTDDDNWYWKDEKVDTNKYIIEEKEPKRVSLLSSYVLVLPPPPPRHRRQSALIPFLSFSIYIFPDIFSPSRAVTLSLHCYLRHYYYFSDLRSFSIPTSLALGPWPTVIYRSLFVHFYQMMTVSFSVLVFRSGATLSQSVKCDDSNHVQCSVRRLL